MFKGKIISRANVNGKVHTFQKDFDDYDAYHEFLGSHPGYQLHRDVWSPWGLWDHVLGLGEAPHKALPAETKYLPEGIDLARYEQRRLDKREQARENAHKRHSLEASKSYLEEYIAENSEDKDAEKDLKKIEEALKDLASN